MARTTTGAIAPNVVENLNEGLLNIIKKAPEPLTPAGIIFSMVSVPGALTNNIGDIDINIVKDSLFKRHQKEEHRPKFTSGLLNFMKKFSTGNDRFITEDKFFVMAAGHPLFKKTIQQTLGKYVNIEWLVEDISAQFDPRPTMNWEQKHDTVLDQFGRNITKEYLSGDIQPLVGRETEVNVVIQTLTRQTKSNPVLIGEAGVGKTSIAEGFASILHHRIGVPSSLHGFNIYEIKLSSVIASEKVDEVMEAIIAEAISSKVILFMDEIHTIMTYQNGKIANLLKPAMARGDLKLIGSTTEDEFKLFQKDKAMVRRMQPIKIDEPSSIETFRILKQKAETASEYHDVIVPQESILKAIALSDRYIPSMFQPDKSIDLVEEAASALRMALESKPKILIEAQDKLSDLQIEKEMILVGNTKLSSRDQKRIDIILEDISQEIKVIDDLQQAFDKQKLVLDGLIKLKEKRDALKLEQELLLSEGKFTESVIISTVSLPEILEKIDSTTDKLIKLSSESGKLLEVVVTPEMISDVIEVRTGIPVGTQDADTLQKYNQMEDVLKRTVHGQNRPIDLISAAIKRSKAGLSDPNKPIGSFLCLGPTGVGKTYLAQELAKFMFDTDRVLHRFDMSEYMEPHSVSRLFGSPPGYVGHDAGGQLTEEVKRNPYSIILFDEIEKAHSKVFDSLLQVLDSGRMTDGQGVVVDFKNTIIIMTSNYGSEIIRAGIQNDIDIEDIEDAMGEELRKHFRPEFLNRFDAKVVFNSLTPESVCSIAESELNKLADRLLDDNGINLVWHPDTPIFITNVSYDIMMGARPIKRYINEEVVDLITNNILGGEIDKDNSIYLSPEEIEDEDKLTIVSVTADDLALIKKDEVNMYELLTLDEMIEDDNDFQDDGDIDVPETEIS